MMPHFYLTSHKLKRVLLVFFYFYTSISLIADKLVPSPLMKQEGKWLVQALQQAHFNKVLINDLKSGDIVLEKNLTFKRPGTGISPGDLSYVIGRKVNKDLKADALLKWENIK